MDDAEIRRVGPMPRLAPELQAEMVYHHAGFWRRVLAFFVDYLITGLALLPLFMLGDLLFPGTFVVKGPTDALTQEVVLEEKAIETERGKGVEQIVEKTHLGSWTYLYRRTRTIEYGTEAEREVMIDRNTRREVDLIEAEPIVAWVFLLYLAWAESSRFQTTLGKAMFGIRVTNLDGGRISFLRALGRNLGKLLSFFSLTIGFMMCGWTQRRQCLHDMLSEVIVHMPRRG